MKVAERAESLGYIQRLEALRSRSNILRSCELSAKCVASGIGYRGYAIPRGGEWRCWGGAAQQSLPRRMEDEGCVSRGKRPGSRRRSDTRPETGSVWGISSRRPRAFRDRAFSGTCPKLEPL